jgi:hypothetical protein
MIFSNDTFFFKSIPLFYEKEKSGLKNNTIRIVDETEKNIIVCALNRVLGQIGLKINIKNTENEESFTRAIKDISFFTIDNEICLAIFTWKECENNVLCNRAL